MIPPPLASERGSAPAALLAWIGVTMTLLGALALLGQGLVAQARAATAADLAALAAADSAAVAGPAPCGEAERTAQANGAALTACALEGGEVTVTVRVPAGLLGEMIGRARAGPGRPDQAGRRARSRDSAPALDSGSLPLPHLGETTQAGQPSAQEHSAIMSAVARTQAAASSAPRSAKPAPPGAPSYTKIVGIWVSS